MKIKFIPTIALSLMVGACAYKPIEKYTATDDDFNYYFKNQVIKVNSGVVLHPDHGEVSYSNKLYQADYHACSEEAFSGHSFLFGKHNISDPDVITQMSDDDTFLFFQVMVGSKKYNPNSPMNKIFKDKAVLAELRKASPLISKTLECTKTKGWQYPSSKK